MAPVERGATSFTYTVFFLAFIPTAEPQTNHLYSITQTVADLLILRLYFVRSLSLFTHSVRNQTVKIPEKIIGGAPRVPNGQ